MIDARGMLLGSRLLPIVRDFHMLLGHVTLMAVARRPRLLSIVKACDVCVRIPKALRIRMRIVVATVIGIGVSIAVVVAVRAERAAIVAIGLI